MISDMILNIFTTGIDTHFKGFLTSLLIRNKVIATESQELTEFSNSIFGLISKLITSMIKLSPPS
jgi:hypothetical protein